MSQAMSQDWKVTRQQPARPMRVSRLADLN